MKLKMGEMIVEVTRAQPREWNGGMPGITETDVIGPPGEMGEPEYVLLCVLLGDPPKADFRRFRGAIRLT